MEAKERKKSVQVGFANEGTMNLKVSVVEQWEPKKISYIGDTVFFDAGDAFVSMKRIDFKEIFNK